MTHRKTVSKLRLTIICKIEIINPSLREKKRYNFTEISLVCGKYNYKNQFKNMAFIIHTEAQASV